MDHLIERKAISDLLIGGYFYIPPYQRGYRWTSTQVVELLSDLFSYVNEPHDGDNLIEGDYYCIQPIIARLIINKEVLKSILPKNFEMSADIPVWEIIDGQQRLTTIYILYKYLMTTLNISDEDLERKYGGKKLYHIIYATRKDSADFLEKIRKCNIDKIDNIDHFHMQQAYNTIEKWICSTGEYEQKGSLALCKRYGIKDNTKEYVKNRLFELLNASKWEKNDTGSVQVLWYELPENSDAIAEFSKINTGRIYLTDAELIKAIFLKKHKDIHEHIQMQRALEWENIENTLHNDSFWYFLNKRGTEMPNRIDFIFQLAYKAEHLKNTVNTTKEEEIAKQLKKCDKELQDKNRIFNFYYDKFDSLNGENLSKKIEEEWDIINQIYYVLEDWYDDVVLYNLIGMLCQYDENLLPRIYIHFLSMDENKSREDFKEWLKDNIRKQISNIEVTDNEIHISYGDEGVFNLLLLLNVNHLNRQAEKSNDSQNKIGSIYKFPFAVLTSQKWDIEHIDSFTKNGLKRVKDQEMWIETAMQDLELNDDSKKELNNLCANKEFKTAIEKLRELAKEDLELSDEIKNSIGNLTLLDSNTNRAYGNSLFITKRNTIINKMKNGLFVPISTSFVFMKLFDSKRGSLTKWTKDDMMSYQKYICEELKDYLKREKKS